MSFLDKFKFKRKPFQQPQPAVGSGKQAASEVPKKSAAVVAHDIPEHTGDAYRVLVRPLVTEKTARLAARGQYGFIVTPSANKRMVADAVAVVYGIRPVAVNMISMSGKDIRFGQTAGRRKNWKKAIVTLPPGKKIAVYEGV